VPEENLYSDVPPDVPSPAKPAEMSPNRSEWTECIAWLRAGRCGEATEALNAAAEREPCPRDVFLRTLEIATACLEQNRASVARGILVGLMDQAEQLDLERWESPLMLTRMFSLLHRSCSRPEDKELRDKAYNGLCRLVPWKIVDLEPAYLDGHRTLNQTCFRGLQFRGDFFQLNRPVVHPVTILLSGSLCTDPIRQWRGRTSGHWNPRPARWFYAAQSRGESSRPATWSA